MLWYMIDGFNGYEINKEGIVRSMKMMNANPGHYIKLYKDNKGSYYYLSNNFNKRVKIYQNDLLDIVFNQGKELKPRNEEWIYMGSRNKHFYFDGGIYSTNKEENHRMDFSKYINE